MNENIENIVKIDIPSFQDMCKRITELEKENKQLKADNQILGNELTYFKEYAADLENEVNRKERMVNGLRLNLKSTTAERNEYCKKCNALSKELTEEKQKYNEFYETEYIARIEECNRLFGELMDIKSLSMFEFANKYCNDDELEEAGHAFARELLGGA